MLQEKAAGCSSVIEALPSIFEKIPNIPAKKSFMDGIEKEMVAKAQMLVNSAKQGRK